MSTKCTYRYIITGVYINLCFTSRAAQDTIQITIIQLRTLILLRLWLYINHALTYLLTYVMIVAAKKNKGCKHVSGVNYKT